MQFEDPAQGLRGSSRSDSIATLMFAFPSTMCNMNLRWPTKKEPY